MGLFDRRKNRNIKTHKKNIDEVKNDNQKRFNNFLFSS